VSRFLSSLTPRFNRRDAEARRRSSRYVILPGDAGFVFFVVNNQKKKKLAPPRGFIAPQSHHPHSPRSQDSTAKPVRPRTNPRLCAPASLRENE
jgi:hypothetical protein